MTQERDIPSPDGELFDRRWLLRAFAGVGVAGVSGCCSLRPFATSQISETLPATTATPFKPVVHKAEGAPQLCVDAHTHFFNASDVPVKGYLAGAVAHSMIEPIRSLLRALAPFADRMAELAPTAAEEYAELIMAFGATGTLKSSKSLNLLSPANIDADQLRLSKDFYNLVRGSEFEKRYNAIKAAQSSDNKSFLNPFERSSLNEASLFMALNQSAGQGSSNDKSMSTAQVRAREATPYADGILAFVGHMLSPRWRNLQTYSQAYSSGKDAFGIDYALGALVDFDGWLDCPPRSSHDDQVRLHQLLCSLSGGYMKPLVAYNPWSDIRSKGASLERVRDAVQNRGFIGVKIYPPNGFRALGNVDRPGSPSIGPSFAELDKVLLKFWETCAELEVPVMAHTNETCGVDEDFDKLGGPDGWEALLKRTTNPRVNFAHFGGDDEDNDWTSKMARMMSSPEGQNMYGDIGYWSDLRCRDESSSSCKTARDRLAAAVAMPGVGKRILYGTDWFMMSKERDWARYPFEMAKATRGIAGLNQDDLFGKNAVRCFSRAFKT